MAKIYEKLQNSLISYEDWPKAMVTEQTFSKAAHIIRGQDRGRAVWYYILVPVNNIVDLKAKLINTTIHVTDFGLVIKYLNNRDEIKQMSGTGTDPPVIIQRWVAKHYSSPAAADENTNLKYIKDDIRLCTIQRAIPQQLIGVHFHYFAPQRFHYMKLIDDLPSSLAHRAGLKSYDRIIFFNDKNIENETDEQFRHRFNTERHLPVQMLVCSPATYAHYKANKKIFHCNLRTIRYLKPVYATSTSDSYADTPAIYVDKESFCAVQWENSNIVSTVSQSAIFKSPEFTNVNDICFINTKGNYRKGQIIFKGSFHDCEKMKTHSVPSGISNVFNTFANLFVRKTPNVSDVSRDPNPGFTDGKSVSSLDATIALSSQKSSQKMDTDTMQAEKNVQDGNDDMEMRQNIEAIRHIQNRVCTRLEELPNELFNYVFTFIDIQHLFKAFWGLNSRLNNIFQSCQNLSLIFDEKTDLLLMTLYAPYVTRLIIHTSIYYNFSEFSNLHELVIGIKNSKQIAQIQPKIVPNLTHLSFLFGPKITLPRKLIRNVFSNKFPSLRHVNLCRIDESDCHPWTMSPSLQFVSVLSCKPATIPIILASCPNLYHLQVHLSRTNNNNATLYIPLNHPLRRLTLWSDYTELTFNIIDNIVTYTPNIEYLYLQTIYRMSFVDLARNLFNRLHRLSQFGCYIQEMLTENDRTTDLTTLHQVHSCFERIQCIEENDEFRIFATK